MNVEELVHSCLTKEMYLKSYQFTIPSLPSEKYWPIVELPLNPPPIKIGPGRPKKNRKKDPHELPKKPGKLSRHGLFITCQNCFEERHNKASCTVSPAETSNQVKRKRGRPRKTPAAQASQSVPQSTQPSKQSTQGQKSRGRPKKYAKTTQESQHAP